MPVPGGEDWRVKNERQGGARIEGQGGPVGYRIFNAPRTENKSAIGRTGPEELL